MTKKTSAKKEYNNLELLRTIITGVATILVPILIAFITTVYKDNQKEQIQLKYIDFAIEILKEEPSESNLELRKWAIDVLDNFSSIPLNSTTKEKLHEVKIKQDSTLSKESEN